MNALEQLLNDDVTHLIDRLAVSIPDGTVGRVRDAMPTFSTRIDDVEARLATTRAALLRSYACWRQAPEDAENTWALGAWRIEVADEPMPGASRIAA